MSLHLSSHCIFMFFFSMYAKPRTRKNILLKAEKCHITNEAYVTKNMDWKVPSLS